MIVIQLALLAAVQAQPDVVVTATLAAPPLAVGDALVGDTENEQGAPACVIVTVCPAIVIVPVCGVVAVFAATL